MGAGYPSIRGDRAVKKLRRHIRLFTVFVRTCLVKEMEFRGNFWAGTLLGAGWVMAYLVFAKIIFANTNAVGGWTQGQTVMLIGTYTLSTGLVGMFFARNLSELPNQIRLGNFDFTLLKPVNSQFFVSLRYLSFTESGTITAAIFLVFYGASLDSVRFTLPGVLGYLAMLTCGLTIYYSVYLMLMSTAFWFIKVENLWTLGDTVFQVARAPMNIYGRVAFRFFTFVLPLVFVAHIPSQALISGVSPVYFFTGIGMASVLLFISSRFWEFATRFYSSASS